MKVAPSIVLSLLFTLPALGGGQTSVEFGGNTYTNINKVYLAGGRVIILFPGGGTSTTADKLPADFVSSWLSADTLAKAEERKTVADAASLSRAIARGSFREVDGRVYDIRRAAGWVSFQNVKMLQVLTSGAIIDTMPNDVYADAPIFVRNLPSSVGDTDLISLSVLPAGTYSYVNKNGDDRTIRAYDFGRICDLDEIPREVLSGEAASADAFLAGTPQRDVVATLPNGVNLGASGSGFFVSADGYLITNHHIVKGARRLQIKTADATFPATLVRVDETNDLALIKVSGHFSPLHVSASDPALGDPVFTIGFPDVILGGTQPKYTAGTVSSLGGIKDNPADYQISVPVQPGNSGGPLANATGEVTGVIVARLDDFSGLRPAGGLPNKVNYAVKGSLLRDFLKAGGEVDMDQAATGTPGAAMENVKKSVAMVLVY